MIDCLSCGAETSNGLALCELCQRKVTVDLEFLPIYFRNLARWRPGRAGSRPVPGSRVLYDGGVGATGDRISRALDEAGNALSTWARRLADDRGLETPAADGEVEQMIALCEWLSEHLVSIATLDWCGDFTRTRYPDDPKQEHEHDGIGYHEAKLRTLTESSVPGWYAGACARRVTMDDTCGAPTYVVPGLTWVTCAACGSTTYARDRLEIVLAEAGGWVAPPMRLAEAIVALVDTEMSTIRLYERVKKWGQRGRVTSVRRLDADGDEVGPARYRLGEVLTVLFAEGATRLDEPLEQMPAPAS